MLSTSGPAAKVEFRTALLDCDNAEQARAAMCDVRLRRSSGSGCRWQATVLSRRGSERTHILNIVTREDVAGDEHAKSPPERERHDDRTRRPLKTRERARYEEGCRADLIRTRAPAYGFSAGLVPSTSGRAFVLKSASYCLLAPHPRAAAQRSSSGGYDCAEVPTRTRLGYGRSAVVLMAQPLLANHFGFSGEIAATNSAFSLAPSAKALRAFRHGSRRRRAALTRCDALLPCSNHRNTFNDADDPSAPMF